MDRVIEKKKFKLAIWQYLLIILGVGLIYGFFFNNPGKTLKVDKERLRIAQVTNGKFQEFVSITGNVLPIETFYVGAEEGGRIEEIFVEDGSFLKKGEPILRLANTSLQLNFMNRESQILDQINNLRNTKVSMVNQSLVLKDQWVSSEYNIKVQEKEYTRSKTLFDDDLISQKDFDDVNDRLIYLKENRVVLLEKLASDKKLREMQEGQLNSSMAMLQRSLDYIENSLKNLIVKAPAEGQLSALRAELGLNISPGATLGQIDDLTSFKIRANVDEYYVSRVQLGQMASLEIGNTTYVLEVKKIFPEVSNGNFVVELFFENEIPANIRRGQSISLKLELGASTDAQLLTRGRFYQSTGGQWVYKLNKDKRKAFKVDIQIGRQNPSFFEVKSGLVAGDWVIVSGYDHFNNSDELNLE